MIERILHNNLFKTAVKFITMWVVLGGLSVFNFPIPNAVIVCQLTVTLLVQLYFIYKKQSIKVNFLYLTTSMLAGTFYVFPTFIFIITIIDIRFIFSVILFYLLFFVPTYMYIMAFLSKKAFNILSLIIIILAILSLPIIIIINILP